MAKKEKVEVAQAQEGQVKKDHNENGIRAGHDNDNFSMPHLWGYITRGLDAVKAKDYLCAYRCFSEANCLIARTVHPDCPVPPTPILESGQATLEDLCNELESMTQSYQAANWFAIALLVMELVRKIVEQLRNEQE